MTAPISLTEAADNAKQAVAAIRAEQPASRPRATLAERFAQFWVNRRIAKLRSDIAAAQERIRTLSPTAAECKRKAQVTYEAELKNIDLWRQAEYTAAKIAINSAQTDLAMLGEEP